MNVACPTCNTIFRVDPAKVPEAGVRARCAVCSSVFAVRREPSNAVAAGTPAAPSPVQVAAPGAAPVSAPVSSRVAPAPPPPVPPPATAAPSVPAAPPRPPGADRPAFTPPPAVARPAASLSGPAGPAVPGRGPLPPAMPGGLRPPAFRPPVAPRPGGSAQTGAIPPPPPRPPVHAAPVTPTPAPTAPPPAPATPVPAAASAPPAAVPARPINPFLTQDPAAKARRLARALISDMVVYHPAKRQEGLRDGTLKQLFDEEIKKSWEEYADQVGKDVADSTPYFREALNEILADGKQLF
jgi:predicted Zn finger-like uncharacterized protein